jgi:aspartokinase
MTESTRLGGFKVLKDVIRISLFPPRELVRFPQRLFAILAENRINLPYLTILCDRGSWSLNIIVDVSDHQRATSLIEERFGRFSALSSRSAILSLFPHRRNPEVSGKLFEAFDQQGLDPDAMANSPSAISVVVKEELLQTASLALFEPFSFSAYRTPEDWKLAQEGKEELYKEVVASYQEKRPGVYGLEYQEGQELIQLRIDRSGLAQVGNSFKGFARLGLNMSFLATSAAQDGRQDLLAFCLPLSEGCTYRSAVGRIAPEMDVETLSPVTTFSMNGPHFGDRYGIVSELLRTLEESNVRLLALSCTVASITGVVPQEQSGAMVRAIQARFDVPTVTKKE